MGKYYDCKNTLEPTNVCVHCYSWVWVISSKEIKISSYHFKGAYKILDKRSNGNQKSEVFQICTSTIII